MSLRGAFRQSSGGDRHATLPPYSSFHNHQPFDKNRAVTGTDPKRYCDIKDAFPHETRQTPELFLQFFTVPLSLQFYQTKTKKNQPTGQSFHSSNLNHQAI